MIHARKAQLISPPPSTHHNAPASNRPDSAGRNELSHLDKRNWAHVGALKRLDCSHDSNLWTRAIYFEWIKSLRLIINDLHRSRMCSYRNPGERNIARRWLWCRHRSDLYCQLGTLSKHEILIKITRHSSVCFHLFHSPCRGRRSPRSNDLWTTLSLSCSIYQSNRFRTCRKRPMRSNYTRPADMNVHIAHR